METRAPNPKSLIDQIYSAYSNGVHSAAPTSSLRTNEAELVRGVLRMLQGFSGSLFYWNHTADCFRVKSGIYVPHLSLSSLREILNQFIYAATCLQLVDNLVSKVDKSSRLPPPTLKAFVSSASAWLKRFRDFALTEETKMSNTDNASNPTLLGLTNSLFSLCSGAEYLLQIVKGTIPKVYLESSTSVPAAEVAVHVLDFLYQKLDEVCLIPGGEEEAYQMVLHMYVGSLLPYVKGLDSWLFEGILDDPYNELFFYANRATSIDEAEFWEKSYSLRLIQDYKSDADPLPISCACASAPAVNGKKQVGGRDSISLSGLLKGKEHSINNHKACPFFIKDLAKSIVSTGKSLQLMCHIPPASSVSQVQVGNWETQTNRTSNERMNHGWSVAGLTLSEVFCVSLAGLVGDGDHVCKLVCPGDRPGTNIVSSPFQEQKLDTSSAANLMFPSLQKIWYKFLVDTFLHKEMVSAKQEPAYSSYSSLKEGASAVDSGSGEMSLLNLCTENPILAVCQTDLRRNKAAWNPLNLSQKFCLPPLNDGSLREAIFGGKSSSSVFEGTNYIFGFQFGGSEYHHSQEDRKLLEMLFPFPTILPSVQDTLPMSDLLPFQKNSTLPSRVLRWIQLAELRVTSFPLVVIQECLTIYIKKQVDYVGQYILLKLMNDWRLMDELAVFRAIYLLGSGDLLQHFLSVIFNKLDKGEGLDDDFELNTILQESIRNSSDYMLLSAPDSLVVSISKGHGLSSAEEPDMATSVATPCKSHSGSSGIDGLDSLKFTYKVPWPLELIANKDAINKYNQVMQFLLKVKRAKFVLDKVRRWMWKGGKSVTNSSKHHWLVEQKLLHFVDAFHQYVMDRVYHSAWRELCEGVAVAGSLDEVIEVHEAYLMSIQRQCFVVPDKLWALIASRINSILSLALDFYSIQQTLNSGGAVSAIKARCEMEVDRIEKQFDDCIAFLLRVLSFKLNVGHFPHLADLVTRINYSYYYMSASGNLMTSPSSEAVTMRLGRSFLGRTD